MVRSSASVCRRRSTVRRWIAAFSSSRSCSRLSPDDTTSCDCRISVQLPSHSAAHARRMGGVSFDGVTFRGSLTANREPVYGVTVIGGLVADPGVVVVQEQPELVRTRRRWQRHGPRPGRDSRADVDVLDVCRVRRACRRQREPVLRSAVTVDQRCCDAAPDPCRCRADADARRRGDRERQRR